MEGTEEEKPSKTVKKGQQQSKMVINSQKQSVQSKTVKLVLKNGPYRQKGQKL